MPVSDDSPPPARVFVRKLPDAAAVIAVVITVDAVPSALTVFWSLISIVTGNSKGKSSLVTPKPSLMHSILTAVVLVEALLKNEPVLIETPM